MNQQTRQIKPVPKKITAATWSALSVMAMLSLPVQNALAQSDIAATAIQKVEITGSSIKRIDAETALRCL
ncbi:hypothetical protein EJG51_007085 [Undibacterium piscinae]|uniref:TonB-dependent receptor n=1 Tax=Undibacterium piscinae TaxID=2495591 RepID=A0A6M4A3I7_9BURK|nr:hypothetical protein EJG51_007085 [Undibacterium piscinae]